MTNSTVADDHDQGPFCYALSRNMDT